MPVKQATTTAQQVSLIKQKGFIVTDDADCEKFFDRHNYYRVSAYLLPFKTQGGYIQGIPFSRIKNIYAFDSALRKFIISTIEQIEHYCRTVFSRIFVNSHGALGYMDASNYSSFHDHVRFQTTLQGYLTNNKRSPVVKHHQASYGGDFPLWVMIEFFSIGTLSYFYSDMKSPDQKAIASVFGTSVQCLKSWMRCLTDLRNRCAHFSRLYYWKYNAVPRMPSSSKYTADRRLFSQILMLSYMYPDTDEWNQTALPELKTLIVKYSSDIDLAHNSFPIDWETQLTR